MARGIYFYLRPLGGTIQGAQSRSSGFWLLALQLAVSDFKKVT